MPETNKRIYLDFNASTPVAPEVASAMRAVLEEPFGNPSSDHWAGVPAREAVEKARCQVAHLLDCNPGEVVFTSGGSESNNHALKGVYFAKRSPTATSSPRKWSIRQSSTLAGFWRGLVQASRIFPLTAMAGSIPTTCKER